MSWVLFQCPKHRMSHDSAYGGTFPRRCYTDGLGSFAGQFPTSLHHTRFTLLTGICIITCVRSLFPYINTSFPLRDYASSVTEQPATSFGLVALTDCRIK